MNSGTNKDNITEIVGKPKRVVETFDLFTGMMIGSLLTAWALYMWGSCFR
jgi:patatin-like phospholipase/acyl hydrolase